MWQVLWAIWGRALKALEHFGYIARHGEFACAGSVIPLEVDAKKDRVIPVCTAVLLG